MYVNYIKKKLYIIVLIAIYIYVELVQKMEVIKNIKDIKSLILPKDHIDEIYNRIKDYDALIKKIDSWIDWYKSEIILKIKERLKKSINEKNNRKNDV